MIVCIAALISLTYIKLGLQFQKFCGMTNECTTTFFLLNFYIVLTAAYTASWYSSNCRGKWRKINWSSDWRNFKNHRRHVACIYSQWWREKWGSTRISCYKLFDHYYLLYFKQNYLYFTIFCHVRLSDFLYINKCVHCLLCFEQRIKKISSHIQMYQGACQPYPTSYTAE